MGHPGASRDASEGQHDNYDGEDDSRSNSGSVRSKPQSRDITPFTSVDGMEGMSEREKRKIKDIEKKFEMIDQAQQPPRKKKRTSDAPSLTSPVTGPSGQKTKSKPSRTPLPQQPAGPGNHPARLQKDASVSRQQSGSPSNGLSPKTVSPPTQRQPSRPASVPPTTPQRASTPRGNYVDQFTQTDSDENAWYSPPRAVSRKLHVPLSKRLLNNQYRVRTERERRMSQLSHPSNETESARATNPPSPLVQKITTGPTEMDGVVSTNDVKLNLSEVASAKETSPASVDVPMPDAPPVSAKSPTKPPPPPWPAALNPVSPNPMAPSSLRSPDLKVQMPPLPSFSSGLPSSAVVGTPGTITPSSASASGLPLSPFATTKGYPAAFSPSIVNSVGAPSPARKKMSLGDYSAMKKKVPEATTPSALAAESTSHASQTRRDEARQTVTDNGDAPLVASPVVDHDMDGLAAAGAALAESAATKGLDTAASTSAT